MPQGIELVKRLVADLSNRKAGQNVDTGSIGKYQLGTEGLDGASLIRVKSDIDSVHNDIMAAITNLQSPVDGQGVEFTTAQINAAKLVSNMAICSKEDILKSITSTKASGMPVVDNTMFIEDNLSNDVQLAQEAYDGMQTSNALFFSVAYNLVSSRQDEFGEAFFPTITIDATQSGLVVENTFAVLQNEITRGAGSDRSKYNKTPLIKVMYDGNVLAVDRNKCVPVYRDSNKQYFLTEFKSLNKDTGKDIETAPLVIGKRVDLLGISQTDEQLAKGVMDNTDALDRTIQLEKVYVAMINNSTTTETFAIDIHSLPYSNFVANPQQSVKEMALNFVSRAITIDVNSATTANGTAATIFAGLEGTTLKFELNLNGSANIETGDFVVFANGMELIEITKANGDIVPLTDDLYTKAAEAFHTIQILGYTVDAYRTNSNLRTRGHLLTIDRYKQEYQVPLRSGIHMLTPINTETGRENDVDYLNTQIQATQLRTSADAVKTLVRYSEFLNANIKNGVAKDLQVSGIGRWSVDPYYKNIAFEVSQNVDSINSKERIEDIKATILNRINDAVLQMDIASNYGAAHRVANNNIPTAKTVIIGTDPRIKFYLTGNNDTNSSKIKLNSEVDAIVVSTYNKEVYNKIFITFGVYNNDRNSVVNPLNFGNMVWAPTVAVDVNRTVNGSTSREIFVMPRYAHIIHLPILVEMTISDIDAALSKVNINNHVIA